MNETSWLSCSNPHELLTSLAERGLTSDRKLRLFAVARCRQIWHLLPEDVQSIVDMSEWFADGQATVHELEAAIALTEARLRADSLASGSPNLHAYAAAVAVDCSTENAERLASTLFAALRIAHAVGQPVPDRGYDRTYERVLWKEVGEMTDWLRDIFPNPFRPTIFDAAWRTETAVSLASLIYEKREFSLMAVLGDALQDVGCADERILEHCREDGVHSRGCWVVDALLGKN